MADDIDAIDARALARRWVHAHEEDAGDGTMVFRPAEHDLPPSRGRRALDLAEGGELAARRPGPDDRPQQSSGTWRLTGNRLEIDLPGRPAESLEVVSLEPDRLVVRPVEQPSENS